MLSALLDLLAPPACLACRGPGPSSGAPLCAGCRRALPWLPGVLCPRCGLPVPCAARGGCCPAAGLAFERAWAPVAYDGTARALVQALKERGAVTVAQLMAAHIAANAPPGLLDGAVLVPVPGDPLRRRVRGVDHAARLAAEVGRRAGIEHVRALRRVPGGPRQAGASRQARMRGGRVAIRPRLGDVPPVVVLVDDVHTTGATLHACAAVLRSIGSREVRAVTWARTLPFSRAVTTL